jgi:hypothetical protein
MSSRGDGGFALVMTVCSAFAGAVHSTILARLINYRSVDNYKITVCDLEAAWRIFLIAVADS